MNIFSPIPLFLTYLYNFAKNLSIMAKMYKSTLFVFFMFLASLQAAAGNNKSAAHLYIYNKEYDVFMNLDLKNHSLIAPGHELYGPVAGYMGKTNNSFYWIVISAEKDDQTTTLQLINDFGSEDLTATLTQENDSVYTLKQGKGNTIRLPNKGKWQKMPKTMIFKRSK